MRSSFILAMLPAPPMLQCYAVASTLLTASVHHDAWCHPIDVLHSHNVDAMALTYGNWLLLVACPFLPFVMVIVIHAAINGIATILIYLCYCS